ncbi:unnamed protein product [Closterium sp. NIES-65]|nr:unnamed protein product [Closterium sp. NIES-65]
MTSFPSVFSTIAIPPDFLPWLLESVAAGALAVSQLPPLVWWLLLAALAALLLAFLYNWFDLHVVSHVFVGDKVKVVHHAGSNVARAVFARMRIPHFWPTPWLCSPHLQTTFVHFCAPTPHVPYIRHVVRTPDGGTLGLDWAEPEAAGEGCRGVQGGDKGCRGVMGGAWVCDSQFQITSSKSKLSSSHHTPSPSMSVVSHYPPFPRPSHSPVRLCRNALCHLPFSCPFVPLHVRSFHITHHSPAVGGGKGGKGAGAAGVGGSGEAKVAGGRAERSSQVPIVIVVPGLTSQSNDKYMRQCVAGVTRHGWRALVPNHRGLGGVTITSNRFYNAGWTTDLRFVISLVQQDYPHAPLYAIGTSLGANILVKYLGEEGASGPIQAAVSIGNPWDLLICDRWMNRRTRQRVYNTAMVTGLRDFAKLHKDSFQHLVDVQHVMKARTIRQFDDRITRIVSNYETVDTYYRRCGSAQFLPEVAVPLLAVSALDDPICTREAIPWDEAKANPNVVLAVSHHGGHLAYLQGLTASSIWWVQVSIDFLQAVVDARKAGETVGHALPVSSIGTTLSPHPHPHIVNPSPVSPSSFILPSALLLPPLVAGESGCVEGTGKIAGGERGGGGGREAERGEGRGKVQWVGSSGGGLVGKDERGRGEVGEGEGEREEEEEEDEEEGMSTVSMSVLAGTIDGRESVIDEDEEKEGEVGSAVGEGGGEDEWEMGPAGAMCGEDDLGEVVSGTGKTGSTIGNVEDFGGRGVEKRGVGGVAGAAGEAGGAGRGGGAGAAVVQLRFESEEQLRVAAVVVRELMSKLFNRPSPLADPWHPCDSTSLRTPIQQWPITSTTPTKSIQATPHTTTCTCPTTLPPPPLTHPPPTTLQLQPPPVGQV